ncbi:MAG: carboxypeptidase regulatory-like domain-containing protein [Candidatus Sulfopaludibacter sp.]|nr:carboxypeptidase regulatory-like domain-containing protein [Candidatus Sulfopaludibacter sp.]
MPPRRPATLLLFLLSVAVPAAAQDYSTLYGRVADVSEGGIAGAAISVVNEDTGTRRAARSESDGAYSVSSLEPGSYTVTVRKESFRPFIRFGVRLEANSATRADFVLLVGSMLESITVHGTAPTLERADASTGTVFEHEEIDRLPLNGGGLLGLLEMVPGTNVTPATRGEAGQFTTNGQRPNANYFTVDGVSANNGITAGGLPAQSTGGTLPAVSAFGSMDALISLEAVQEVHAQTSTTVAEFGRLPGASIALNSQAGGNEFHGSTLYRLRNELLSANDWFANQAALNRLPLRLNGVTQTIGGPIRRNRTFFFLSYEHIALNQPFVWAQPVPSLAIRPTFEPWGQAAASLYPAPNGAALTQNVGIWTGHTNQPAGLNTGGIRLDQALTSRITLFGRYNDSPSTNQFGSPQVNRLDLRAQSLTLGVNARPTSNLTVDVRVNESQSRADSLWTPECALQSLTTQFLNATQSCDYLVRLTINGIGQLESGREGDRRQRQFQTVGALTLRHNNHSFGLGVDYRRITAVRRDPTGTLSVIADQVTDLASSRNVWQGTQSAVNSTAQVQELSLWMQDTWQATPRLTIAAGLRWEFSPAPVPLDPFSVYNPETQLLDTKSGQPLWPTSYRDFAPRLGVAWRLTKDSRTVLRAGGGLYYDSSMSIATDILNGGPLNIVDFRSGIHAPFSTDLTFGFMPGLSLPEVEQWNVSLERALSTHDTVSVGYVGTAGRGLIRREVGLDNTNSFTALTNNDGASDYDALQLQYRRRFQRGLEIQSSFTWAHSLDNDSSDSFLMWAGPGSPPSNDHASSDFDLRHSFTGAISYELPRKWRTRSARRLLGGWRASGIVRARSGFPITIQQSEDYIGINLINAFRPNLVYGQPLWFGDSNSPGGRRLNPFAFAPTSAAQQGSLGRNNIAGFGMWQADLALSREFRAGDRAGLQLRIEAFNALNHPNFADPVKVMDSPMFGQSSSMLNTELGTGSPGSGLSPILQSGGPRALQVSVRFHF